LDLFKELLINILKEDKISVDFKNFSFDIEKFTQNECYILLDKIKTIIQDDSLSDFECVEKIVCLFEKSGISAGIRHDFG